MSSERIVNSTLAVLALCALTLTALVVKREFSPPGTSARSRTKTVRDWASYLGNGEREGPADAAVTIIEFSDFQCPYCRHTAETLSNLRAQFKDRIAIVYRHFPLQRVHPYAWDAAVASECAREQGRFWAYHDALFQSQDSIGTVSWTRLGLRAGVPDTAALAHCIKSDQRVVVGINRDLDAGQRLGVWATPTLLINDYSISGDPNQDTLAMVIRRDIAARTSSR